MAFVDFWSHRYTKSGDFLREIFSEKFEITNFWWEPNKKIPLNEINNFDYIFFFHVMFPYQLMKKFINKKIMWAPMYDALSFKNNFFRKIFWKQISNLGIKVLKFSNKITESIENEAVESLNLRYYIKPKISEPGYRKKINIFFWDRGRIKIQDWLNYFDINDINQIIYLPIPDPGKKNIYLDNLTEDQSKKFIILKENFLSKTEYLNLLKNCDVFVAPRKQEGIGMTVVEAISRGMYIVAYNDSTMNEYINNIKLGFIYDYKTKIKVNINNILNNYKFRSEIALNNYEKWIFDKEKIISFLNMKNKKIHKIHFYPLFLIDNVKFFIKKIFKINFHYF